MEQVKTFTRLVVKPLFASHIDAPEQASFQAEVELDRSRSKTFFCA